MVWPFGCVCQAVRAPGLKWTLLALTRDASDGIATASMWTEPVNHSRGPGMVSIVFLVICIAVLLSRLIGTWDRVSRPSGRRPALGYHGAARTLPPLRPRRVRRARDGA